MPNLPKEGTAAYAHLRDELAYKLGDAAYKYFDDHNKDEWEECLELADAALEVIHKDFKKRSWDPESGLLQKHGIKAADSVLHVIVHTVSPVYMSLNRLIKRFKK